MNSIIVYFFLALNLNVALALHVQIKNLCNEVRWPALTGISLGNHSVVDIASPPSLEKFADYNLTIPEPWAGRVWAKASCSSNGDNCQIGDCGHKNCNGFSSQNTTLVEFNMNNGTVWYDISLGKYMCSLLPYTDTNRTYLSRWAYSAS